MSVTPSSVSNMTKHKWNNRGRNPNRRERDYGDYGQRRGRPRSPALSPHRTGLHSAAQARIQRRAENDSFRGMTVHDVQSRRVTAPRNGDYVFPTFELQNNEFTFDNKHGLDNPNLLERTNPRDTPSLHWVGTNAGTSRTPGYKKGEYVIKGTVTDDGLQGLTNTLKSLGLGVGGKTFNMRVQFLTDEQGKEHYDEVDEQYQAAQDPGHRRDQRRGQSSAHTTLSSSRRAHGRRTIDNNVKAEPDTASVPSLTDPDPEAGVQCANCKKFGHELADCVIPKGDGLVHGCPICNTQDHGLDECPKLNEDPTARSEQVLPFVWDRRFNKPMIMSHKYNWAFLLAQQGLAKATKAKKDDSLGKIRDMAQRLVQVWTDLEPEANFDSYPWTAKYARGLMTGDWGVSPELFHPRDFDHRRHDYRDLPQDPHFYMEYGSFLDVMVAWDQGEWHIEFPVSETTHKHLYDRKAYMNKKVQSELERYGLLPEWKAGGDDKVVFIKKEPDDDSNPEQAATTEASGDKSQDLANRSHGKFDFDMRYRMLKKAARQSMGACPLELPAHLRGSLRVQAKTEAHIPVFGLRNEDDGERSGPAWAQLEAVYIPSTWNDDHVTYVPVWKAGDWGARWAVWHYVNLEDEAFAELPRGGAESNEIKRMALAAIDNVIDLWIKQELQPLPKRPVVSRRQKGNTSAPTQGAADEPLGRSPSLDESANVGFDFSPWVDEDIERMNREMQDSTATKDDDGDLDIVLDYNIHDDGNNAMLDASGDDNTAASGTIDGSYDDATMEDQLDWGSS